MWSRSDMQPDGTFEHTQERVRSSAPAEEVQAWRAEGVDVITVDPGPRELLAVRPRDLRRAVHNDGDAS